MSFFYDHDLCLCKGKVRLFQVKANKVIALAQFRLGC